ncbi:hypothetical protein STAS_25384 [Striga asiatica]|uniref:Uncharacterized protein n=1 Tax=Striga asiatica TaxID=4170 RepID=A0A5A7QTH5_STRAF|nr:hypothetical protein STAS_25384 [Striga asiatica]
MSFLAGRLAGSEGSYFLQESKQAVTKIVRSQRNSNPSGAKPPLAPENGEFSPSAADVLPEVLRHSLPAKVFHSPAEDLGHYPLSRAAKWVLRPDPKGSPRASADALNPLSAYVSLPQVTFGAKRWQLPDLDNSVIASKANDLRHEKHTQINPEKLKAAAEGLTQIGSAFAIATALVFGGATLIFGLIVSKLELHNTDDIRIKGKDIVRPKFEVFREQLAPLRSWAENVSKKWHLEREESMKEKPLIKELSRTLGAKTSST